MTTLASAAATDHPASNFWLSLLTCLPFVLLLGCIALAPLLSFTKQAWHHNKTQWRVGATLGVLGAGGYLLLHLDNLGHALGHNILHAMIEYLAFVTVLGALYAASSGIHITGAFAGFPTTNALLLAIGAVLASLIGTTGAAMLLLRPLLRANADRKHKTHVFIFFIFIVANCGGLLTPMGDPPLFIGFLRGVPFFWTASHLWEEWLLANGLLLAIFLAIDTRIFLREAMITRGRMMKAVAKVEARLHIRGWANVGLLLAVPAVMVGCGSWLQPALAERIGENAGIVSQLAQAALFAGVAFLAVKIPAMTQKHATPVSWAPIKEVAALFFGIFLAMVPAMALLNDAKDSLPLSAPWHYFFATGSLSAVLDNAPTYAVFGELAVAKTGDAHTWRALAEHAPLLLAAISCGAVFMGAMTYIGNGPNFMVKSICETHRIKMPSFFGYMAWSGTILFPVMLAVAWVFFR